MKTRIIGTILIILILGGLYLITENKESTPTLISAPVSNDSALKSLSIN